MKKEDLIKKWLDNELNSSDLEAFKKLEDYSSLVKLSDSLKHFKAPEYDSEKELESVLHKINTQKSHDKNWIKPLIRIAAIVVISIGVYFTFFNNETIVDTSIAQKTSVDLPDLSEVKLNSQSVISFNEKKWEKNREVQLEGEAFFKVSKGSAFKVITNEGIVSVLGTQFNVKQRDNYFEVVCFEGLVQVDYKDKSVKLKPGFSFLTIDGELYAKDIDTRTEPSWLNNESYFKSLPLKVVLNELERQYEISIETINIDTDQLFTGTFKHGDLELALKAVTLPLNLKYQLKNDATIVLESE